MPGTGSRSRVIDAHGASRRPARRPRAGPPAPRRRARRGGPDRADARAAAAAGFRRLLADPGHRVVLAVLPGPERGTPAVPPARSRWASPSSAPTRCRVVLGTPQVTVDTFVVHREHRRRGVGAALLAAAAAYAPETGADHVVAAVGGHEAERQRFFARMGFAPLTTRRIVALDSLTRSLAAWQRSWLPSRHRAAAPAAASAGPAASCPLRAAEG